MLRFKVTFYREMLCTAEITASSEGMARELFNKDVYDKKTIQIVKDSEVVDEISDLVEITRPNLALFAH